MKPEQPHFLERASRWLTLAASVVAVLACLVAPLMAIAWSKKPFPGFMVESTLVVNDTGGAGWSGRLAGLGFRQEVVRVGGQAVATPAEFDAALANFTVNDRISVFTRLPGGTERLYPAVLLISFSREDMARLFWLPFAAGLAYLAIGVWVYRVGGRSRPGRALAFFCFNVSIACTLLFDTSTTHAATVFWTVAAAQLGGALLSLAMRFPEEWRAVERLPWLLAVPYALSIVLGVWGVWALNAADPWAYIPAWGAAYRYAALGVLVFIVVMLYRAITSKSSMTRRQARIVLMGSALAFMPITVWFLAPLLGVSLSFSTTVFLPTLVIFPLSVAIAIFRYRLLEVDTIVNRTVFYGTMTAILAGIASGSITLLQKTFVAFTGEKSDIAFVIATLILVSAFEPVKARMRILLDRRFKERSDTTHDLRAFGHDVQRFLEMSDPGQIAHRLLEEAARGLQAQSGAVSLRTDGQLRTIHTLGRWQGEAWMSVPLTWGEQRYGLLLLGPRSSGEPYSRQEGELLARVAIEVSQAIHRARVPVAALDYRRNGNGADGDDQLEETAASSGPADGQAFGFSAHPGEIS
jgi:hypothetical protein